MPTAHPRSRDVALDAAAPDSGALRAALGETASWRAQAEALARELVARTVGSRETLFDVQRAFAIFPPGSPAGDSLFRLAEALPRIPDRPSRIAMLADRVPALRGWKAAAALPFASVAMHAIGRQLDRKSTRLNSSHRCISYAVFCLKKQKRVGGPLCPHRVSRFGRGPLRIPGSLRCLGRRADRLARLEQLRRLPPQLRGRSTAPAPA